MRGALQAPHGVAPWVKKFKSYAQKRVFLPVL